ncbi:MAG: hypothetical protein WC659_03575 [Patescibacteria group bacterium]
MQSTVAWQFICHHVASIFEITLSFEIGFLFYSFFTLFIIPTLFYMVVGERERV